jgi:low temperature requirement protein LtrA
LIYIIALGEGIVAVGIVAADADLDGVLALTMLLAVAGASTLWWSYFDRFADPVEHALRIAGASQARLARDAYSLGHYPMIAGVVLFAAAAEEIVHHPGDPLEGFTRLLVALSVGLAFVTQAAIVKRIGGPLLVERLAGALVVAVLMVPSLEIRANVMLATVVAVLLASLVTERSQNRISVSGG